jgi:deoxyribodipyrimidine photolyase-related protein
MPKTVVWIPGDQLLAAHPALALTNKDEARVLLIESRARTIRQPYQRKKLVLLFSAMRHYAAELREQGYEVDLIQAGSFSAGLQQHMARHRPQRLLTMAASAYAGRQFQERLAQQLDLAVEILPNTQFLVGRYDPIPDPEPGKRYVMENFYRAMRRHIDLLMEGDEPAGGRWNFDAENRKKLPREDQPPQPLSFAPDALTRQVMGEVAALPNGIGEVEGFDYAVSRAGALAAFEDFLTHRLAGFGDYEDALTRRSHAVYHSLLSPYLNIGLLEPLELATSVAQAYQAGKAPLNAAEGFIRQVIGWREFMYWQYWRQMPDMLAQNAWDAQRELPGFAWSGQTEMACLRYAINRALETGYNHHIERLMLLSNFFMLAGVNPRLANDWFMALYIDAYDWVMPPNVIGMGLNADGGVTATKPYIASANYINKMGDHCRDCRFDPRSRHGEDACPFNFLYWNFVLEHEERLAANPRTSRMVWGLKHLDTAERTAVRNEARNFLTSLSTP